MSKIKIHKIETELIWELFHKSWALIRVNYILTLGIVSLFILSTVLGMIPIIGSSIAVIIGFAQQFLFYKGFRIWESGQPGKFEELLEVFKNTERLNMFIPFLLIQLLMNIIAQVTLAIDNTFILSGLIYLFFLPIYLLIGISTVILFFNYQDLDFKKTIALAIDGITTNLGPFILGIIIGTVIITLSAIMCFIPFLAVGLPVTFGYNYLWYRCVHEGLIIEVEKTEII